MEAHKYLRFDWAMRHILREKENFEVLEGFLSTLLQEDIVIDQILECSRVVSKGSNNSLALLAYNERKELVVIDIHSLYSFGLLQRMHYATVDLVSDLFNDSFLYRSICRVYSINLAYFELDEGQDSVYYGKAEFIPSGIRPQEPLDRADLPSLFIESYILTVNQISTETKSFMDEWMLYLSTGKILPNPTARGLARACEVMLVKEASEESVL